VGKWFYFIYCSFFVKGSWIYKNYSKFDILVEWYELSSIAGINSYSNQWFNHRNRLILSWLDRSGCKIWHELVIFTGKNQSFSSKTYYGPGNRSDSDGNGSCYIPIKWNPIWNYSYSSINFLIRRRLDSKNRWIN
jgi:hypothetical protein